MPDDRSAHMPRACPLAPSQEAFVEVMKEASKAAIRETRSEWGPGRMQKLSQWFNSALLLAIATTIFYAGANLEGLRGELKLAAQDRASINREVDETADGFKEYARATTAAIKELAEQVATIKESIAEMRGQRDGWRNARERREGER